MKCVVCRFGETELGTITYNLDRKSMILVVKDVPAEVCDACGEGFIDPSISERLDEIVNEAEESGAEVLIRKHAPVKISSIKANGVQRGPADEFIDKLELGPKQLVTKKISDGREYQLDAVLPNGKTLRFGSVRLNIGGQDPGKLIVYAIKDFDDPKDKFVCQPKNPKHCWYKFWPDDDEAMTYAIRAVKSAYESKV